MRSRLIPLALGLLTLAGCADQMKQFSMEDALGFVYHYESAPMEGAYMYAMEGSFTKDGELHVQYQWDQRRTEPSSRGWNWDEIRGRHTIEGDMVNYWRKMLYRSHVRPGDDLEDPDVVHVGALSIRFPGGVEYEGKPYNIDEWSHAGAGLRTQLIEKRTPVKSPTPGLIVRKRGVKAK